MKSKDTQKPKSRKECISEDTNTPKEKGYTDDGFKIVSFVPEDDSDVSDAFESCSEEEEEDEDATTLTPHHRKEDGASSAKKSKRTEDGFKIVTDIPPDDSDVSDAFDDDDDVDMSASCHQEKNVAKPILQIMSDFGKDQVCVESKGTIHEEFGRKLNGRL
ncbi:hypothetical protein E2C01_080948 [Portunus trituberculatus]|uniref:Uncharacterized protein n=1 Tax=Portunus trituberculatus TaxID=210409 RepID=A0A5B7IQP5_PORTR|nr:hypothetical protein [Portunus trituberculatus]